MQRPACPLYTCSVDGRSRSNQISNRIGRPYIPLKQYRRMITHRACESDSLAIHYCTTKRRQWFESFDYDEQWQARPIRIFSNRPITVESNRIESEQPIRILIE